MRRHRLMAVAFATLATMIGLPGRAEIGWEPSRTWVFAVGILEWEHGDIYSSFPDAMPNRADRRLFAAITSAGVPDHQVVFLKDEKATLAAIRRAFESQLDRTKEGDLLIFYFAGHGSRDRETRATYFANYDAGSTYASHWHFDAAWDEWVSPDRVRTPRVPHVPKGTRVEVLWPQDKTWYPATVMASQFGLHKVHYDGYSHEWDDWVAFKSIKVLDE